MSDSTFTSQDSGARASVPVGARITIELRESPASTGYRWTGAVFDENVISLETEELARSESAAVGAAGKRRFVFRAKATGETRLRLVKKRSWETEQHAAELFDMQLTIQAAEPSNDPSAAEKTP